MFGFASPKAGWLCLAVFGFATTASAHGTNPGTLLMRLAGDTLYVTATPEMAVFSAIDTDRDGHISARELTAGRARMLDWFEQQLTFATPERATTKRLLGDISRTHTHGTAPTHLRVTLRYRFSTPPSRVDVHWALASQQPLSVRAQRMTANKLTRQRPLTRMVDARLDAKHPKARLFELKTTSPRRATAPQAADKE